MNVLYFEDDELDILIKIINKQQMCFHPHYAPMGCFTNRGIFELKNGDKNVMIIADNNLVSPISEIAVKGTLKDKKRLQKVALFVTWLKVIGASITCGIGLLENDTAKLNFISGEENRQYFLHAVDKIPAFIWKEIAFGNLEYVPNEYLFKEKPNNMKKYEYNDSILYLSAEAAIIKIVQFIRTEGMEPIDKFIKFMEWYCDNLLIAESIVVYAAMVFTNTPNVEFPKKSKSNDFEKIVRGIKNQAWDITYITTWSTLYYHENKNTCNMFATDDITQKSIIVNIIPIGESSKAIEAIFSTKMQKQKLKEFYDKKLGTSRVKPFDNTENEENMSFVKRILNSEYKKLKEMCERL